MPDIRRVGAIDSFATLVAKKLLLPSQKTKYVAVDMAFLVELLSGRVERIYVDEKWYLDGNPDVRDAVTNGVLKNAREHYLVAGFYEHRMPHPITVDEDWYLDQYDDIRAAVHDGVFASAQAHFESRGFREGRCPHAGFQLDTPPRSAG